ncbi:MAG: carboxypeptidase regulatory-like domain-containing protein, partial [Acidobacteria bacterium]|nr:carboxypeptidase regulatory-like domain-containing protein [Acidobacteriota bacterium]
MRTGTSGRRVCSPACYSTEALSPTISPVPPALGLINSLNWEYTIASMFRMIVTITLSSVAAFAQGNLGGLTGNVVDTSGATVPGAKLSLKSQANNQVLVTESSDAGYVFRGVQPGPYSLEVEKTGFKKFVRQQLSILTATQSELLITLEVGATSDSVTVASAAIELQTSSPEVSTVLQRKTLLDLPIQIGSGASTTAASGRRQPETFIFLTPGVVGTQWGKSINGSPEFGQEILIDGISAQLSSNPGFLAQTSPPYEAIEEFKVQNTLFPAEYGRGFGVINYTLKSGTNRFHGGLFEFLRNDKLDARPFFNRTRPIVRFNEYGGNLGGPVWLPKLYNGKDRTFFNFNYTGLRNSPPLPGNLVSVPTPEFLRGDFSRHVDSAGSILPVFDPATTTANGTRTPFPGNVIPAARLSRVARNTVPLLPGGADLPGYFNNFLARNANPVEDDIWSLKADHLISANHRASFVVWRSLNDQFVNSVLGRAAGPLGPWFLANTKGSNYRINYDGTVKPTVLIHAGYGYTLSNPTRRLDERKGNQT